MTLQEQMQTRLSNYTEKRKKRMSLPSMYALNLTQYKELMFFDLVRNLLDKLTKEDASERLRLREARCDPWLYRRQVPPPFLKPYPVDHYLVEGFLDRNGFPAPAMQRRVFMTDEKSSYWSDSDSGSDIESETGTDAEQDAEPASERSFYKGSTSDASLEAATDTRSDAGSESTSVLDEEEDHPELEWRSTNHGSDLLFLPDNESVWNPLPRSPKAIIHAIPASDALISLESDGGDDGTDTVVNYDDRAYSMDLATEEDEDEDAQVAPRTSRASRSKGGRGGRVGTSRRAGIAASSNGRQRARTSARIQAAKARAADLKRTQRAEARSVRKLMQSTEKKLARAAVGAKSLLKNLAKLDAM